MWEQMQSGRVRHRFEPVIFVLALLVIPVVLIEESHTSDALKLAAAITNWVIWAGFTLELVGVLVVAPRKRAALNAHLLDALIVIVTPPFLPGLFSAMRAARLIRVLRLTRLGLLGSRAIRSEHLLTSRETFRYIALFTAFLVVVAGATISVADTKEFPTIGLGMWWAITTVTTVGYGDVVPHTVSGRVIASLLMLIGIGFLSILTATIASSFVRGDTESSGTTLEDVMEKLHAIERRLDALSE